MLDVKQGEAAPVLTLENAHEPIRMEQFEPELFCPIPKEQLEAV